MDGEGFNWKTEATAEVEELVQRFVSGQRTLVGPGQLRDLMSAAWLAGALSGSARMQERYEEALAQALAETKTKLVLGGDV